MSFSSRRRIAASVALDETEVDATVDALQRSLGQSGVSATRCTVRPTLEEGDEQATAGGASPMRALTLMDLGPLLGEGGMGVVREGFQRDLGRRVALKTLKSAGAPPGLARRLLREAWLTGALEHPNVIPVYELAVGDDGAPVLVMRLIDGSPWSSLIADDALLREKLGATDALEFHLRVLVQICHALSLAHERRIIHRDVKPENVMLGRHGEVYLVDWGIALSLDRDPSGRLPFAGDASQMAGTPCYMAPEMLRGDASALGPETDVYLAGAVLYEVLTGSPPHDGETLAAVARSVLLGPPSIRESVPEELRAICERAMSQAIEDRYPTADALREAIEAFLRHRGALQLTLEAEKGLDELRRIAPELASDETMRPRVYTVLGQTRFGFLRALDGWPENLRARAGLEATVRLGVGLELGRGAIDAAYALVADLPSAPPDLVAAIDAAAREHDDARSELARFRFDGDRRVGRRARLLFLTLFAAAWTARPLVVAPLARFLGVSERALLGSSALSFVLVLALITYRERAALLRSRLNRSFVLIVGVSLCLHVAMAVARGALGPEDLDATREHVAVWVATGACMTIALDARWGVITAALFGAYLFSFASPSWTHHAISLANATGFAFMLASEYVRLRRQEAPGDTAAPGARGAKAAPSGSTAPQSRDGDR